jgi:hypothetical protein
MITKEIHISDDKILYDVNFVSWKTAKCRIVEPEARAEAQTDSEAIEWYRRQKDTAIAELKSRLRWCVQDDDECFRFRFSDAWRGNFEALGSYIHRYIVDYILYEWFRMTLPSEASVYLASAEQWEDKIINEARSEDVRNVYFRL